MKQLNFIIDGQKLTRTDALEIVSDAIGQFEAVFSFDEWWDGYTPTAQFTKDGKTIDCILEDNKCVVPPEALQGGGIFYVNVFSTDGTGDRKTANEVAVPLKASGYKADGSHSVKPTPTIYEQLLKKIDKNTVMNGDGVVASPNADFAEVAEWSDGNPDNEDRIGYFVCFDVPTSGIIMRKANADDDAKGITVSKPSFAGNCTKDKFDENGKLLPQYEYVGVIGLVPVHDNGECVVGGRCMPTDGGIAAPSPNDKGYQVVERYSDDMILVAIEPNGDMICRLQEQVDALKNSSGVKYITEMVEPHQLEDGIYIIDSVNGGELFVLNDELWKIIGTQSFLNGVVFVVTDIQLDAKQITVITKDKMMWYPQIFTFFVDYEGNCLAETTKVFVDKKYVDEQIATLQSKICDERLYTFSFEELDGKSISGTPVLQKNCIKTSRGSKQAIRINFLLFTGQINEDGTITPYFDLPIEYNVNPQLMIDDYVNNSKDFTRFGFTSPLVSNNVAFVDDVSKELVNDSLFSIESYDFGVCSYYLNKSNGVKICGVQASWYLLFGDEESRDGLYNQVIAPVMDSITHLTLKYEKHNINTIKPKYKG